MKTEKMTSRVKRLINILDKKTYNCPQAYSYQSKEIIELLIEYYKGNISKMKLAEVLELKFSKLKIYLLELERRIILDSFKLKASHISDIHKSDSEK